jgi:hypothetical protein
MRYRPDEPRLDDPATVAEHKDKFKDKKALIVLGGYSASDWEKLRDELHPDLIIGANGVNAIVPNLDYWLCAENMTRSNGLSKQTDSYGLELMEMFHREAGAKYKMVSHRSWGLLRDTKNCIKIRRNGRELNELGDFSFRDYGMGFLAGGISRHVEAWQKKVEIYVGTVAFQCLHLAGVLGCSEVHTIGFDLCFKEKKRHHAYQYPTYKADRYRTEEMFTTYKGVSTMWAWIETAQYLKAMEWMFKRDGIDWHDHSDGLLKIEGLDCTK